MSEQKEKKPKPTCYTCGFEIIFDPNKTGSKGGMIPLDPATREPHQCLEVKAETKDSKPSQAEAPQKPVTPETAPVAEITKAKEASYLDHTLARPSEVKYFVSGEPKDVEQEYKQFQLGKKFAWTRAHSYGLNDEDGVPLFVTVMYYELKEDNKK